MKRQWLPGLGLLVLTPFAASAVALGGNSGGGGDLRPPQALSRWELDQFIRDDVPRLVRWFYAAASTPTRSLTAPAHGKPDYWFHTPTYEALYSGSVTIFDRLDSAHIETREGPCTDPNTGRATDASADGRTGVICLNVDSILKSTPARTQRSHVLGLAVHEYAHLMGLDEAQAKFVGGFAESFSTVDGSILARFEGDWADLAQNADAPSALRALVAGAAAAPITPLAFSIMYAATDAHREIMRADALMRLAGLSPWTPLQRARAMVAQLKLANLNSFACALPGTYGVVRDPKFDCADYAWFKAGGPRERTVSDLLKVEGVKLSYPADAVVRNLTDGDRAALAAELRDVAAATADLFPKSKR